MNNLKNLKIISLSLFIVSLLGILGTLIISNILVTYKISFYNYPFKYSDLDQVLCSKENNYCKNLEIFFNTRSKKLDECRIESYRIDIHHAVECKDCDGTIIPARKFFISYFDNNKFIGPLDKTSYLRFNKLGGQNNWKKFPNNKCILNSKLYKHYINFPLFFNEFTKIIDAIKINNKYTAGHSYGIMPYFYGESSISNIAKRFPTNYVFKTLMIFSSLLILLYWRSYNKIFETISNQKKIKVFYFAGVLSSILLFLHVVFLGIEIEVSYFKKIKRLILILFIFFELFAQANLVINLYAYQEKIKHKIRGFYLDLKKYLIILILSIFVIGIGFYIFIDLGSNFNNIVEWNFFTALIFFYFFSYLMWNEKSLNFKD